MKQEPNNEIDLLLRRLSRRQGAPTADGDLRIDSDHLDADELSLYAENGLPAVARARYTEHLADCSSCRKLVVQLSSSAGVVTAEETSRASEPSGLRKFFASLFSPMVLRYAAPALGLIVVAVIGFALLRPNEADTFVAQLERNKQSSPAAAAPEQPHAPTSGPQPQEKLISPGLTSETRPNRSKEESRPSAPSAAPSVSVTTDVKTDARTQKAEPQRTANAAPAQPAPKPAETTGEVRNFEEEAQKQKAQGRIAAAREGQREGAYDRTKGQDKRSDDVAAAAPAGAKAMESRRAGVGGATSILQRDNLEKDSDDAETRSVAGRRFRKQRGIWVDTAYNAETATVNLTRGSEQYRALVADEPAIKTIAEQLDGQIIVVWKGRAYRIR